MFEIRDERGNTLDSRPTFEAAEQRLDELCAEATRQAAANGEGTAGMTLAWTIVDTSTGEMAATMSMSPGVEPYRSVIAGEEDQA